MTANEKMIGDLIRNIESRANSIEHVAEYGDIVHDPNNGLFGILNQDAKSLLGFVSKLKEVLTAAPPFVKGNVGEPPR